MLKRAVLLSLVGLVALAASLTMGSGQPAQAGNEDPDSQIHVIMFSSSVCLAFGGAVPADCFSFWRPGNQQTLAEIVTKDVQHDFKRNCPGGNPGVEVCRLLPSDFENLRNLSGAQLHSDDPGTFKAAGPFTGVYVLAFVPDDQAIEIRTSKGKFVQVNDSPGPFAATDDSYICNGQYDDCNDDGDMLKGMIAVPLGGYGAELGPGRITVSQGTRQAALDFTVVGEPDSISIETFKGTITNGIVDLDTPGDPNYKKLSDEDECPLPTSLAGFTDALGRPDKTVLIGRILDEAGTQITQGWVYWSGTGTNVNVPIGPIANFGAPVTPTVNLGSFGFGAPQVLCGTKGTGLVTARAQIFGYATGTPDAPGLPVDPEAHAAPSATLDFEVIGQVASITAVADPPVVDCNGTNSAKVTATVLTADGQPIANGQSVRWDVVALGTANPITSKTGGGKGEASTVVTPLSPVDELRGVTVNISTIPSNTSAKVITTAVRVDCFGASVPGSPGAAAGSGAGAGAGAGTGPQTGVIRGPNTGSGPAADGGALAWWPLVMLAAGAVALAGARFATKRD